MKFTRVGRAGSAMIRGRFEAFLIEDNWDDYSFKTLFLLVIFNEKGERIEVGAVKILSIGLPYGQVVVPENFEALPDSFCSVGQDKNYYETLAGFPDNLSSEILGGLRDCVSDQGRFRRFKDEAGFQKSLLRSISEEDITKEFPAALGGQAELTPFRFIFIRPLNSGLDSTELEFSADPSSTPPTNVHVIIGRNSAGKTRLLREIAATLCTPKHEVPNPIAPRIVFVVETINHVPRRFANLVTVTFSAFDLFKAPSQDAMTSGDIRYAYVGLKRDRASNTDAGETKGTADLEKEFSGSVLKCRAGPRRHRLIEALRILEADPGFEELEFRRLLEDGTDGALSQMMQSFGTLSAGHKIVMLTVSRLVELVEERTLVLMDEPEAHLHPPLLSSLIRVVSTLMTRRNGVAVVATHSPVILQEVPKSCVWILRRSGKCATAERPQIETFGENVGVLTREVFGLEVTDSGFHQLVRNAVGAENSFFPQKSYKQVLESFDDQLGSEARAIVRALAPPAK